MEWILEAQTRMRTRAVLSKSSLCALMKARSAGAAICTFQPDAKCHPNAEKSAPSIRKRGNRAAQPLASAYSMEQTEKTHRASYKLYAPFICNAPYMQPHHGCMYGVFFTIWHLAHNQLAVPHVYASAVQWQTNVLPANSAWGVV